MSTTFSLKVYSVGRDRMDGCHFLVASFIFWSASCFVTSKNLNLRVGSFKLYFGKCIFWPNCVKENLFYGSSMAGKKVIG